MPTNVPTGLPLDDFDGAPPKTTGAGASLEEVSGVGRSVGVVVGVARGGADCEAADPGDSIGSCAAVGVGWAGPCGGAGDEVLVEVFVAVGLGDGESGM